MCRDCSNVDIHELKREAEFYCVTPLSEYTLLQYILQLAFSLQCQCTSSYENLCNVSTIAVAYMF